MLDSIFILFFLILKILLVVMIFLTSIAYVTFAERKISAGFQRRKGPNRAGPFGLLQPLADGIKLFFKEEFTPDTPYKFLFTLAPLLVVVPAFCLLAVIPLGPNFQITDLNVGILYLFALTSLGVYGVIVGGWSSNNKYSMRGAMRASAQLISYEIPMGLAAVGLLMVTGTFSLKEIVEFQSSNGWLILAQPFGFLLFFIASLAEAGRMPFDLPEAEAEIVGYHTEYSSMKFGLFQMGEFGHMILASLIMATLFFGGWNFPFLDQLALPALVMDVIYFGVLSLKTFFLVFVFMWIRWTLPRFRYDQLMNMGWKFLIPAAIFNLLATAFFILMGAK
jgi:NADH-quinone oxidoreductase subunit H